MKKTIIIAIICALIIGGVAFLFLNTENRIKLLRKQCDISIITCSNINTHKPVDTELSWFINSNKNKLYIIEAKYTEGINKYKRKIIDRTLSNEQINSLINTLESNKDNGIPRDVFSYYKVQYQNMEIYLTEFPLNLN